MRLVVLSNPRSGRGRARRLAAEVTSALTSRGHAIKSLEIGGREDLDIGRLGTADALIVVGGDGTVHHTADAACEAGAPVYHVASGNENLFAREFSMRRDPESVIRAVEDGLTQPVDLGVANGRPFLIMTSVGPDASIIHRLDRARSKAMGHLAYVVPGLTELVVPYLPRLTITVDGERVIEGARGLAVVANSPQYALRIDPARHASMHDGRLDVVFYPARTAVSVLGHWLASMGSRATGLGRWPGWTGREITVEADASPVLAQADGESFASETTSIRFGVRQSALPVRLPPWAAQRAAPETNAPPTHTASV